MIETAATSTYVSIDPSLIAEASEYSRIFGDSETASVVNAFTNLNNALQSIMFQFQNYANLQHDEAMLALASGGFGWKAITPRQKQKWGVKNTFNEGVLALKAEGGPLRSAHYWLISLDTMAFSRLCPTRAAETLVKGLAQGLDVCFIHQLITKDGPQGFVLVIKNTVSTL